MIEFEVQGSADIQLLLCCKSAPLLLTD